MDDSVLRSFVSDPDLLALARSLAVSKIVSGVFHELNQPLCGIRGFAELAQLQTQESPHLNKYATMIREQSDRLNEMLTDFRKLYDATPTANEVVDLISLINEVLLWTDQQVKARNITFDKKLPTQIVTGKTSKSDLKTVLLLCYAMCRDRLSKLPETQKRSMSLEVKPASGNVEIYLTDNANIQEKVSELERMLCEMICKRSNGEFKVDYSPQGLSIRMKFQTS